MLCPPTRPLDHRLALNGVLRRAGQADTSGEGMSEGPTVDIFQLATQGDPLCNTGDPDPALLGHGGDVVACRHAFDRRVDSQNYLAHITPLQTLVETIQTQLIGSDAIQR